MKKFFACIMIIMMIVSLTACGPKEEASKDLNVFMMSPDTNMAGFLSSYSGENRDMTVNIEIGLTNPEMEVGDVLKKLNTKLMSDDGPDIIILDGINPKGYIESGQLADLSKILKKNKDLIAPVAYDKEKTYYVPLAVGLIADIAEADSPVDFSNTEAYVKSLADNGLKCGGFNDNAIISYKADIEPKILKNDGISEEELKNFFENIKSLLYVSDIHEGVVRGGIHPADYTPDGSLDYTEVYQKNINASRSYVMQLLDLQALYSLQKEGAIRFDYAKVDDEFLYMPNCIVAVNENSKNKEAAMEMVEYLLSEEGQREVAYEYIPVNRSVLEEVLKEMGENDPWLNGARYTLSAFTDEEVSEIMDMVDDLNYECNSDAFLMEIVIMAAQDYANGEITLEAALENAMSKIKIYLSE